MRDLENLNKSCTLVKYGKLLLAKSGQEKATDGMTKSMICRLRCDRSRWTSRASRSASVYIRAEKKEYYDYKDMPPLPMTISKISIPELGYTVVDKNTETLRLD